MKYNSLIIFVMILISFSSQLFSQHINPRFNRITSADGISQSYVVCAFQDSRGFMWFGTQDGLNRYDGYNFKIYRHVPDDPTSLSENWIWNIYEDSRGYLWFGTFGGGASRFDRNTETFKTFRNDPDDSSSLSHNTVWSFYESSDGELWIGTNIGLNLYHSGSQTFTGYSLPQKENVVFRILPMDGTHLMITSINEVYVFNITTKTFSLFNGYPDDINRLRNVRINIFQDSEGIYWMGSDEDGIFRYDPANNNTMNYKHEVLNPDGSLINNMVLDLISDRNGNVWAATINGLSILQFNGNKLTKTQNFINDPANPNSISGNYLSNVYESSGGEIWISARDALNRFDQSNNKFLHFNSSSGKKESLSHNGVLPIIVSKSNPGIIWIGTRNGLNKYDDNSGKFVLYKHSPANPSKSISGNYILSLLEDSNGALWVGTRGEGLCRITFNNSGIPSFMHLKNNSNDKSTIGANNIHFIYEDRNNNLWIGTGGGGLNRYNPDDKSFTRYNRKTTKDEFVDDWVYAIHEDQKGNLWLGTAAGGLNLFDRDKELFTHFRNDPLNPTSISNNRVLSLMETRSGDLWIGTALGLNKLIKPANGGEDFTFKQYYETDGLPNDVIYGILEDDSENLWVSTNKGLCKISVENDRIEVRSYSISDGLQSDEFDQNAFAKGIDGKMYFGGINGFNVFHPDSVKDNLFIPPVVITDFKIMNESVPIENNRNLSSNKNEYSLTLKKSIAETDTIILSYKDDMISFEFAALNFTVPEKNQYAYMMDGFDKNWIYSGTRRFVTYTNLDAGEYTFRVKGSNNDGIWNEAGTSLTLIITPPPWATWWAYLSYALMGAAAIFLFIRIRIRAFTRELEIKNKIENAKLEEREAVRKKSSADFHDEAGNKLTKISLFTELAKGAAKDDSELKDYLNKIEENTKEISSGMRDFIWVLDPAKDSLLDTINRLRDFGNSMFGYTDTNFNVIGLTTDMKNIILSMEHRRALMLIFKEAMNNCLKYSEAKNIEIILNIKNEILELCLVDDGVGFNLNNKSSGYGIKNMKERAEKLNAVLEIITSERKGTKIIFKGNITHMGN